jgi:hypothetical protein
MWTQEPVRKDYMEVDLDEDDPPWLEAGFQSKEEWLEAMTNTARA